MARCGAGRASSVFFVCSIWAFECLSIWGYLSVWAFGYKIPPHRERSRGFCWGEVDNVVPKGRLVTVGEGPSSIIVDEMGSDLGSGFIVGGVAGGCNHRLFNILGDVGQMDALHLLVMDIDDSAVA